VFSSTGGALYGEADTIPSPESTPAAPMAPYGTSKYCAEQYLGLYNRLHGTRHLILRYGNVYGPRQDPHGEAGVVAIFCSRLLAGQPLVINGDGHQTRDFVHVSDVAAANLLALERADVAGQVNIGTGVETSVNAICDGLSKAAGSRVETVHAPERPGEQRRSCLSPKLAERLLGWRPTVLLDNGLAQTLEHFRKESGR
jgi:UDP-glucose 4-epimerase